jgi:hypothetical protein
MLADPRRIDREIGEYRDVQTTPQGELIEDAAWTKRKSEWLPTAEDGEFIASLMKPHDRARTIRRLDRAAVGGHRQLAGRFRIRKDRH